MSQENVETIKAVIAAFNRGDWDAALGYAAPDIGYDTSRDLNETRGIYEGREGVKHALERFYEPWESWRVEIDELDHVGENTVERGDLEEVRKSVDPEIVIHRWGRDAATPYGWEGLLAAIAEWVEGFHEFTLTGEEFIDANEDQVIVRIHQKAVGAHSGVPIEADFWHVHTMRDGKGTRLDMVATKAEALEAAGL
jgi:ketosteroid isomerase-like protein